MPEISSIKERISKLTHVGFRPHTCHSIWLIKPMEIPAFEGFSERVSEGSDEERTEAYGRWLERLRRSQSDSDSTQEGSIDRESN